MNDFYVMQMKHGDYFLLKCPHRPETHRSIEIRDRESGAIVMVLGGDYQVLYGPCSETDAERYLEKANRRQ